MKSVLWAYRFTVVSIMGEYYLLSPVLLPDFLFNKLVYIPMMLLFYDINLPLRLVQETVFFNDGDGDTGGSFFTPDSYRV
jgi:hypothetical protein